MSLTQPMAIVQWKIINVKSFACSGVVFSCSSWDNNSNVNSIFSKFQSCCCTFWRSTHRKNQRYTMWLFSNFRRWQQLDHSGRGHWATAFFPLCCVIITLQCHRVITTLQCHHNTAMSSCHHNTAMSSCHHNTARSSSSWPPSRWYPPTKHTITQLFSSELNT